MAEGSRNGISQALKASPGVAGPRHRVPQVGGPAVSASRGHPLPQEPGGGVAGRDAHLSGVVPGSMFAQAEGSDPGSWGHGHTGCPLHWDPSCLPTAPCAESLTSMHSAPPSLANVSGLVVRGPQGTPGQVKGWVLGSMLNFTRY